jgi:hypothetical protein
VSFPTQPVLRILPILALHICRRLNGRQHGKKEVQKNFFISICPARTAGCFGVGVIFAR